MGKCQNTISAQLIEELITYQNELNMDQRRKLQSFWC